MKAGLWRELLPGFILGVNCMYSREGLHQAEMTLLTLASVLRFKHVLTWEII